MRYEHLLHTDELTCQVIASQDSQKVAHIVGWRRQTTSSVMLFAGLQDQLAPRRSLRLARTLGVRLALRWCRFLNKTRSCIISNNSS